MSMAGEADEFREICLIAAKLVFKKDPRGGISFSFREKSEFPAAVFFVCVSYDGRLLDTIPFGGMGSEPIYPKPSIPAVVLSDQQGMFGRHCPGCSSYFRTDACPGPLTCPYCGHAGKTVEFTTENQLEFIQSVRNAFLDACHRDEPVILDLGKVAGQLPDNRPEWHYAEEQQQGRYTCSHCSTKYDVLGQYASCPRCRKLNLAEVFAEKMGAFDADFKRLMRALQTVTAERRNGRG